MNLKSLILLFLIVSISVSCSKTGTQPVNTPPAAGLKFLALGDSYTIGQSVSASERFPVRTAALLRDGGLSVNDPDIIATTGWTTGNLLNALNATPPANNYDIVTLLIGVNNQYQGRSIMEYRTEFTNLLNKAIQYAGNRKERVFVLSIPDYSVTPFAAQSDTAAIADAIDLFNAANKEITLSLGVKYIDITPISREGRYDNSLHANDGLHPSGKQYQRWANVLAPIIRQVFP